MLLLSYLHKQLEALNLCPPKATLPTTFRLSIAPNGEPPASVKDVYDLAKPHPLGSTTPYSSVVTYHYPTYDRQGPPPKRCHQI